MVFAPPHCPCRRGCTAAPFTFQRHGFYARPSDGLRIPRFRCTQCRRTFSQQTFRLDYRLKLRSLTRAVFRGFVSKTTQRQLAGLHACDRKTIAHRLVLLGKHCRKYHELRLARSSDVAFPGRFQLDELETFEQSRRLKPLTVPVLIHRRSRFLVATAVGTLPARKPLSPRNLERLAKQEEAEGVRKSQSRLRVTECFQALHALRSSAKGVLVHTDQKPSYASILRRVFGKHHVHLKTPGALAKTRENPLFAINHTLAMLRDGLSRLVRRNWGHAKKREMLGWHLWIYTAWRNYVRSITRTNLKETPAMVAGVCKRKVTLRRLLRWAVPELGATIERASVTAPIRTSSTGDG